jgi:MYXO-CTERM domain-containing protein
MTSPSSRLWPLFSLGTLLLLATACEPEPGEGATQSAVRAVPAHPDVADLPRVTGLATTDTGAVRFVTGALGTDQARLEAAFSLAGSDLSLADRRSDSLGYIHERYAQTRAGLPVVGGDLRVSRDVSGTIVAASAAPWDGDAPSTASIPASQATELAYATTDGAAGASAADLVYVAPSTGGAPVLAWRSRVTGTRADGVPIVDDVFVDAVTGALVDRHPRVHTARNRLTHDAGGGQNFDPANPARSEGDPALGDIDIDLAHDAAGLTYDCLSELFERDSFDGLGADLVSVAHVGEVDENGDIVGPLRNAFWNGQLMAYGEGFAVIDIGSHELGHAVTERTAGLIYQNESGAMNEAMSDILAAICDAHEAGAVSASTWSIGEDLNIDGIIGPFRFMDDPQADQLSSDHYEARMITRLEDFAAINGGVAPGPDFDNGGVHFDSGIANLAFFLLTEGGTHPRDATDQEVVGIGIEAAGQIFYRALTEYMNVSSDFAAARLATEQAAVDLFGPDSDEFISVEEAWFSVGVGAEPSVRPEPEPDPDEDGDGDGDGDENQGPSVTGGCSTGSGGGSSGLLWLLGVLAVLPFTRRRRA